MQYRAILDGMEYDGTNTDVQINHNFDIDIQSACTSATLTISPISDATHYTYNTQRVITVDVTDGLSITCP